MKVPDDDSVGFFFLRLVRMILNVIFGEQFYCGPVRVGRMEIYFDVFRSRFSLKTLVFCY
jgi:hypothetical protein